MLLTHALITRITACLLGMMGMPGGITQRLQSEANVHKYLLICWAPEASMFPAGSLHPSAIIFSFPHVEVPRVPRFPPPTHTIDILKVRSRHLLPMSLNQLTGLPVHVTKQHTNLDQQLPFSTSVSIHLCIIYRLPIQSGKHWKPLWKMALAILDIACIVGLVCLAVIITVICYHYRQKGIKEDAECQGPSIKAQGMGGQ
ncbi:hypothetical protein F4780DRAFT_562040 [Xylariomycetidae sp. FL0641]|nr:hypothetical protein F4780DRAFT_562040 [Xylariomycetidae sp. FL0641]